tara:strand:- start:431 stop:1042 length:612 start_codon:yes stop_codon:yes gene_type:complete
MFLTEEEDKLINWLKQNYLNIILGLALGFVFIGGFNYYKSSMLNSQHEVSLDYQEIVNLYQNEKFTDFSEKAQELVTREPKNIYSAMSNLYLAKFYHDNEQLDLASTSLSHIINNSESDIHVYIASIRLSRIKVSQGEYNDAVDILSSIDKYETDPIVLELFGDIMLIQNDKTAAIRNYELALSQNITPNKAKLIESKLSTIR